MRARFRAKEPSFFQYSNPILMGYGVVKNRKKFLNQGARMSKGQKIAMWVVSVLLAALFLFAGLPKLLMPAKMLSQWVYAPWFLTVVGVCETLGAIGFLITPLAALGAGSLQRLF